MPGCARRCSIGSPIRPTLSKQVRSRTVFAGPCGRNAKSDPWRPLFHSASASPYGLRSSRTELYPLNLQRPKVGQIKPPKWAKPTCQKQKETNNVNIAPSRNRFNRKPHIAAWPPAAVVQGTEGRDSGSPAQEPRQLDSVLRPFGSRPTVQRQREGTPRRRVPHREQNRAPRSAGTRQLSTRRVSGRGRRREPDVEA